MENSLKGFLLALASLVLATQVIVACQNSASPNSNGSNIMPTGTPLSGVTLSGILAGKTIYLLPSALNPPGCWIDSHYWSGTELFVGITSIDWTSLNNGTLVYNASCSPSPTFQPQTSPGTTGNFNIYRAQVQNSSWVLTNMSLNNGQTTSLGALKLQGSSTVFVKYEKTSGNGNIYLTTRNADNSFSTPVAFSQNSTNCEEDNPVIFNSQSQIFFTSSRSNPTATSCITSGKTKNLWSSTYSSGSWQTPVALTGAPATATYSVDQAWVDSSGANLYWTGGGTDCGGASVTNCINSSSLSGISVGTSSTTIALPVQFASWPETTGSTFVSHLGQFTTANGVSFVVCGMTSFVGVSATSGLTTLNSQSVYSGPNSSAPTYYYYHTDFRSCLIQ